MKAKAKEEYVVSITNRKTVEKSLPTLYRYCRKLISLISKDFQNKGMPLTKNTTISCCIEETEMNRIKFSYACSDPSISGSTHGYGVPYDEVSLFALRDQLVTQMEPVDQLLTTKIWYIARIINFLNDLKYEPDKIYVMYTPNDSKVYIKLC